MRVFQRALTTAFLVAAVGIVFASGAAQAKKFEVLESFGGHKLGSDPRAPVLVDKDGNIFGTASQFGPQGGGTVFELKRVRHGYKASSIFRFNGVNSGNPTGALIMDTQGNLYGIAYDVAFELSPVAGQRLWSEKILHQFCSNGCGDGNQPVGGLTYQGASTGALYDGASPLFGATASGGADNAGTVFELTNSTGAWSEAVLYNFCSVGGARCLDGSAPHGGLTFNSSGALYGATFQGGGNNVGNDKDGAGVIFQLTADGNGSWTQTVLHRFCAMQNCADGANPEGELLLDSTGRLFGTTLNGLSCKPDKLFGCGVVYQMEQDGSDWVESVLYIFCSSKDCKDGQSPESGLTLDATGALIGTTWFGGGNDTDVNGLGGGVVFELAAGTYKVLHSFCSEPNCADGEYPLAGVSMDSSGRLFGTTSLGGEFGNGDSGTVFEIEP